MAEGRPFLPVGAPLNSNAICAAAVLAALPQLGVLFCGRLARFAFAAAAFAFFLSRESNLYDCPFLIN